jgi:uncharacterized protein YdeI (YjbR/CyaY-like superfamily)
VVRGMRDRVRDMRPRFFRSGDDLRAWLDANHDTAREIQIGFYKRGSGRKGITYREAVDQALCYGWIDGVTRSIDDERWTIRFTPRTPTSSWSQVNVRRVNELSDAGLMRPSGLEAFRRRTTRRTGSYSYENRPLDLDERYLKTFRKNRMAWEFHRAQPPGYRRTVAWWVMSAKREETRARRLAALIERAERGERIP